MTPVRRELPLSIREVIRACLIVAAVSFDKIFLILFTFLNVKIYRLADPPNLVFHAKIFVKYNP